MATFVKIASSTVGSGGASNIVFSSIPQTYTDLCLKVSARSNRAASEDGLGITINSASTNYTYRILVGNGSSASSSNTPFEQIWSLRINGNTSTTNTFGNAEIYFPNYTSSNSKAYSGDGVTETNASDGFITLSALYQSSTSAITGLTIQALNSTLMQHSTFVLYGISKS